MGLALIGSRATKLECVTTNHKLSFLGIGQILRDKMSRLKSLPSIKKPYGFDCPHIRLSVNNQKIYNASLDIIADENFNHLKFFNAVKEIWLQLKKFKQSEYCKRITKNHTVFYQFKYFALDSKKNKVTTVIRFIGDTRINLYKFSIESDGKFGQVERELMDNVLNLTSKYGVAYNDFKALSKISKAGWVVIESFNNTFSLENSFAKESLRTSTEIIMQLPSNSER